MIKKNNAKAFYLPTIKRPIKFGLIPDGIRDYWHTGIVYDGKVYETFSHGKNMVSDSLSRLPELNQMGAEWQDVYLKTPENLTSFLKEGLSCDNYVEKVLGLSLTKDKCVVKRDLCFETSK